MKLWPCMHACGKQLTFFSLPPSSIRFSNHADTSFGLVQLEGGPCGVLAPIQALLMKHLLFPQGEASPAPRTSLSFTSEQRNRLKGQPQGWRQQG